jgi:hypothetical protein
MHRSAAAIAWIALSALPARAVCLPERPDDPAARLRLEVVRFPGSVIASSRQQYNRLELATRSDILHLKERIEELSRPEFEYLDVRIRDAPESEPPSSPTGYRELLDEEEHRLTLQMSWAIVDVDPAEEDEDRALEFTSEVFIAGSCGVADCIFEETERDPPAPAKKIIRNYQLVLLLFALALDADENECGRETVLALCDAALAKIQSLEEDELHFRRMRSIKNELLKLKEKQAQGDEP